MFLYFCRMRLFSLFLCLTVRMHMILFPNGYSIIIILLKSILLPLIWDCFFITYFSIYPWVCICSSDECLFLLQYCFLWRFSQIFCYFRGHDHPLPFPIGNCLTYFLVYINRKDSLLGLYQFYWDSDRHMRNIRINFKRTGSLK